MRFSCNFVNIGFPAPFYYFHTGHLILSIFVIANTIMFLVIMTKAFPVATLITILRELDLAGAEGVAIAGEGAEVVVDF